MIVGIFHQGSGLGNQLHRYVATRVLALDKGYEWGMLNPELFKGESFMKIDKGIQPITYGQRFQEKKVVENGVDIRGYDPEINFVEDWTIIDGEFQDERYFSHHLNEIREWLKVEPLEIPNNLCVIGFRGGEYTLFPDLFLTQDYWNEAIERMKKINPDMRFEVHTDDPLTARGFFPNFKIIENQQLGHSQHSNMGLNWRAMRYAKYAIIANSSFCILPRLIKHYEDEETITLAPRYWARRNTKIWALQQNYYRKFIYV